MKKLIFSTMLIASALFHAPEAMAQATQVCPSIGSSCPAGTYDLGCGCNVSSSGYSVPIAPVSTNYNTPGPTYLNPSDLSGGGGEGSVGYGNCNNYYDSDGNFMGAICGQSQPQPGQKTAVF